jgi:hypothetical protein
VVVVVAVVVVAVGAVYAVAPKGGGGPDAKEWDRKASAAFSALVRDVPELSTGAREWLAGERTTERFRAQVDADLADFVRTRNRVSTLGASPKASEAGRLYERSAQLYVEVARVYSMMVRSQDVELRPQLDLLARRVRELADRVFDRGRAALAPYLGEAPSKDIQLNLPEEVPIWPDEGLAPGPPLEDQPPAPSQYPPLRQATRSEQSPSAWARDVRASAAPPASELRRDIDTHDAARLRLISQQLVAAAERLRGQADPKGEREKGARVRLSLLVAADAARAAQAATFLTDRVLAARLTDVARRLALVSDALWAPELGPRRTGFDIRLLAQAGL